MQKLKLIWKIKTVRNSLLFILFILLIFRIGAHIPLPGVDMEALRNFFNSNEVLGLLNLFSGGGMKNFSIFLLGVGPYITASIIMQLLQMIIPSLEALAKEGEAGRQKINQYTRYLTIPLAFVQGYSAISLLKQAQGGVIVRSMDTLHLITALIVICAGTMLLMWFGELITEKNVGNGVSVLIFAGIIAGLPEAIKQAMVSYDSSQMLTYLAVIIVAVIIIAGVVFITEGQRNIPVVYARGGARSGSTKSHLPLRVNQAGVIPIIFAISIVLFPPLIAQYFVASDISWLASVADWVIRMFNNQLFYGVMYFVLVFAFTYFYTSLIFQPEKIAENLQKQGGFIPGIRPGHETIKYLSNISFRLVFTGALFLSVIATLPLVLKYFTGIQALAIGGTSLLIVVSVALEISKQIDAQLILRDYDRF